MNSESRSIVGLDVDDSRKVDRVSRRLERHMIMHGLTHFVGDPGLKLD